MTASDFEIPEGATVHLYADPRQVGRTLDPVTNEWVPPFPERWHAFLTVEPCPAGELPPLGVTEPEPGHFLIMSEELWEALT